MNPTLDEDKIVRGFNAFSIDLYREVCAGNDNAFFSPFSVAMALSMTLVGARGHTASELSNVLHVSQDSNVLDRGVPAILAGIKAIARTGKNKITSANALWIERSFTIYPEYKARIKKSFDGELFDVDFANPEPIREKINAWVSGKTNGTIPQLVGSGALGTANKLVLTNAIYFLGIWLKPFPKTNTREQPFYLLNGSSVPVSMMHVDLRCGYAETDAAQYVDIPYQGEALAMGIMLPRQKDGLPALEKGLSLDQVTDLVESASHQDVHLYVPRFRLDSTQVLEKIIQKLGGAEAMQPSAANFGGITGQPGVFISGIIHRAYVDVNEEGTEASAATAIVMLPSCAPGTRHEPPTFKADHPFLFFIRDTRTGAILFMGRVMTLPKALPLPFFQVGQRQPSKAR